MHVYKREGTGFSQIGEEKNEIEAPVQQGSPVEGLAATSRGSCGHPLASRLAFNNWRAKGQ